MRNIRIQCACLFFAAVGMGVAQATPPGAPVKQPEPPAHTTPAFPALGPKVSVSALAKMSGGSDVKDRVTFNGSVSNTTTKNVATGLNSVSGDAFGNAAGLSVVIQNSGNSVLIQNSTVVNLQLQQ